MAREGKNDLYDDGGGGDWRLVTGDGPPSLLGIGNFSYVEKAVVGGN